MQKLMTKKTHMATLCAESYDKKTHIATLYAETYDKKRI